MDFQAAHYLGMRMEDAEEEENVSASDSDVSDMLPRRLRYSEEVFPLDFCDDADSTTSAVTCAAVRDKRPLKVYARIKPATLNSSGGNHKGTTSAAAADGTTTGSAHCSCLQTTTTEVVLRMRDGGATTYSFDKVFEGSEQQDIFNTAIAPLIDDLASMRIANSVFMSYGASGTGKSYTMQGTPAQPGVIPLTLQRLFQVLAERGLGHQVQLSYFELYGNKVTDLLWPLQTDKEKGGKAVGRPGAGGGAAGAKPNQQSHQQATLRLGAGFCLPNLLRCHSGSAEDGMALFAAAARLRKKDATRVNSDSSRSHAVFTIHLVELDQATAKGRSATLSLVDLAGAERAAHTQHVGNKLRESAGINSSLSVLRRCLEALRHNQALVQRAAAAVGGGGVAAAAAPPGPRMLAPVRESGLTSLFAGVLSGQGSLVLSLHLSAVADDYALTFESLKFGALASKVTMSAAAPEAPPPRPLPPRPPLPPARHVGAAAGPSKTGHCGRPPSVKGAVLAEHKAFSEEEQPEDEEQLLQQLRAEQEADTEGQLEIRAGLEKDGGTGGKAESDVLGCDQGDNNNDAPDEQRDAPAEAATAAAAAAAAEAEADELADAVGPQGGAGDENPRSQPSDEGAVGNVHGSADRGGAAGLCARLLELEQQLAACRHEVQQERAEKQALEQQLQTALSAGNDLLLQNRQMQEEMQRLRDLQHQPLQPPPQLQERPEGQAHDHQVQARCRQQAQRDLEPIKTAGNAQAACTGALVGSGSEMPCGAGAMPQADACTAPEAEAGGRCAPVGLSKPLSEPESRGGAEGPAGMNVGRGQQRGAQSAAAAAVTAGKALGNAVAAVQLATSPSLQGDDSAPNGRAGAGCQTHEAENETAPQRPAPLRPPPLHGACGSLPEALQKQDQLADGHRAAAGASGNAGHRTGQARRRGKHCKGGHDASDVVGEHDSRGDGGAAQTLHSSGRQPSAKRARATATTAAAATIVGVQTAETGSGRPCKRRRGGGGEERADRGDGGARYDCSGQHQQRQEAAEDACMDTGGGSLRGDTPVAGRTRRAKRQAVGP